jgi:hypothetical protein
VPANRIAWALTPDKLDEQRNTVKGFVCYSVLSNSRRASVPIFFNAILAQVGVQPDLVILLRHQDRSAARGRTPYELWRDDTTAFDAYQGVQTIENRSKFIRAQLWASFVATLDGGTMFVGLYSAKHVGTIKEDILHPHKDGFVPAGSCDQYDLRFDERLSDLRGKLFIDWGIGTRAWVQRAENRNKAVTELCPQFKEPDFPGFLNFIKPLSEIEALPATWISVLKETAGVYLLTCPKTKELYVGSASGIDGFWSRWFQYLSNNNGGNLALRSREYSDYQVSILEVAGTAATTKDILEMEKRWKWKLQSREMGLNLN